MCLRCGATRECRWVVSCFVSFAPPPQHRVLYGVVDACLNLLVEQQVVCELESSTHTGLV